MITDDVFGQTEALHHVRVKQLRCGPGRTSTWCCHKHRILREAINDYHDRLTPISTWEPRNEDHRGWLL